MVSCSACLGIVCFALVDHTFAFARNDGRSNNINFYYNNDYASSYMYNIGTSQQTCYYNVHKLINALVVATSKQCTQ